MNNKRNMIESYLTLYNNNLIKFFESIDTSYFTNLLKFTGMDNNDKYREWVNENLEARQKYPDHYSKKE